MTPPHPTTALQLTISHRDAAGTEWHSTMLGHDRGWLQDYGEDAVRLQDHSRGYSIVRVHVVTVDLPITFYDDHVSRGLPSGLMERLLARTIRVALDRPAYDDLLSDARHYADPVNGYAAEYPGLVASARATVRRLEAVDPPPAGPSWAAEAAEIEAAVADIRLHSDTMQRARGRAHTRAARARGQAWLRYGDAVDRAMAKGATPDSLPLLGSPGVPA